MNFCFTDSEAEEYIALSLSKVSMVENIRLGIEDLQIIRHKATIV